MSDRFVRDIEIDETWFIGFEVVVNGKRIAILDEWMNWRPLADEAAAVAWEIGAPCEVEIVHHHGYQAGGITRELYRPGPGLYDGLRKAEESEAV